MVLWYIDHTNMNTMNANLGIKTGTTFGTRVPRRRLLCYYLTVGTYHLQTK